MQAGCFIVRQVDEYELQIWFQMLDYLKTK